MSKRFVILFLGIVALSAGCQKMEPEKKDSSVRPMNKVGCSAVPLTLKPSEEKKTAQDDMVLPGLQIVQCAERKSSQQLTLNLSSNALSYSAPELVGGASMGKIRRTQVGNNSIVEFASGDFSDPGSVHFKVQTSNGKYGTGSFYIAKKGSYAWDDSTQDFSCHFVFTKNLMDKANEFVTDACNGDLNGMQELLAQNPEINVNVQVEEGPTALMCAVTNSRTDVVGFLLNQEQCLDVNVADKQGQTPIMAAINNADMDMAKLMLDFRPDVNLNAQDKSGRTALMYLLSKNSYDLWKIFTSHRISFNTDIADNDGNTALFYIKGLNYLDELLNLNPKLNFNVQNKNLETYLITLAKSKGNANFITALLNNPTVNPNLTDNSGRGFLFYALTNYNENDFLGWFQQRLDFNLSYRDPNGNPILKYFVDQNWTNVIRNVITNKSLNLDYIDADGNSLLMYLMKHNMWAEAETLLTQRPDFKAFNVINKNEETAIYLAQSANQDFLVRLLKNNGAKNPYDLLNATCQNQNEVFATLIADREYSVNVLGNAFMDCAVRNESFMAQALKTRPEIKIENLAYAFTAAINAKNINSVSAILALRADLSTAKYSSLFTNGMIAAAKSNLAEIVPVMLQLRSDWNVNTKDSYYGTVIFAAADANASEFISALVKNYGQRLDVNQKTYMSSSNDNQSALMVAMRKNYPNVVSALLAHPQILVNDWAYQSSSYQYSTALMFGVRNLSLEAFKVLVQSPSLNVNATESRSTDATAMAQAISLSGRDSSKTIAMVDALMQNTNFDWSKTHCSSSKMSSDMAQYFTSKKVKVSENPEQCYKFSR